MAPDLTIVTTAVALPFVAAALSPLLYRVLGERTGYAGAAVAAASFGLLATGIGSYGTVGVPWVPALDIGAQFTVDGWGLLFALLASGIGVLVFVYSAAYMHGEEGLARYYAALLAFMGSILGVALASDLVFVFLFWELTSLCSFVLIGHHTDDDESRYSARMAMVVTVGGGLCLLAGVLMLAAAARGALGGVTFDLTAMIANDEAMRAALRESGLFVPALGLIVVAAAAKSAQVPLHFWLPNAMVAPTPVSAFLHSATMVKVGVYFLGRVRPLLMSPEWVSLVATLGLLTMTVGALLAVAATDTKELLAYSTASHLGLMVAGFGFDIVYGGEAGAFHLLNHALFKAPLFLVAGIVVHEAGTRNLDDLGGLWRELPVTAAVTAVAALSMAGIPPFNGFYSKELLFEAAYEVAHEAGGIAWLYPVVATLASVLTVVYSIKFLALFFGERRAPVADVHRPPIAMVAPPAVLAVAAVVVSLAPQLAVDGIVQGAVEATATGEAQLEVGLPTHLSPPVAMSAVAVIGGFAAYPLRERLAAGINRGVDAPIPVRPSGWYDRIVSTAAPTSARFGSAVHDGLLRTYVGWVAAAGSLFALAGFAAAGASLGAGGVGGVRVPLAVAVVLGVATLAGVAVATASSHVSGVLTLSILGFMLAIFFILASAPDLALTQLVVETLVLLVFLLVLQRLPSFYSDVRPLAIARDAAVSILVGATAFVSVLLTIPGPDAEPTSVATYYTEQAIPGGGGSNVVNVILVDFRAFDTLGELLVVTIAAIAILVLVTMRTRGETVTEGDEEAVLDGGESP
ncbi:hydrogen gas-evolving membrane-bound hydrogenase subunit E [Halorubrum sp. Eb13]|uniref:hydrogen gas-evolving membrane-bound hydrogenase subunit E n=1 Tax=Halorubrum sp. Eb13 TaxID=1383843 RepID=UPI000B98AB9D|nr:hydrogen gas-evolving membrane-bound hydrogenase subunit E [Halorubrum sp. Eb13]OYR41963.1 Na+/H+ antiporter subunit A [Halorubrum sp. Eb13]